MVTVDRGELGLISRILRLDQGAAETMTGNPAGTTGAVSSPQALRAGNHQQIAVPIFRCHR
jgi:hypothetical protein